MKLRNAIAVAAATVLCAPTLAGADVVLDWNAIAVATAASNPFNQARILAATQLAVFEARARTGRRDGGLQEQSAEDRESLIPDRESRIRDP